MSCDWLKLTLGELCAQQGGAIQTGPFGSQLHTADYKEVGTPVVMPTNIIGGRVAEDGIARIDKADVDRLSQHKLRIGDLVFSRRGDVTKNALVRAREVGWLCGTGCLKVRLGNESLASAEFVSYYLQLPDIKGWLVQHAVGATMPNLNTGILSKVPLTLAPPEIQKRIVHLLGALDASILTLQQQNIALESFAQTLFRSWFVDFDPVHAKVAGKEPEAMSAELAALFPSKFEDSELGLIPKGWSVTKVKDLLELSYGRSLVASARKKGSVPVYGSGGLAGFHDTPLVQGPSVIVGRKGTIGTLYWEDAPFYAIDTVFYVKPLGAPLTYCYQVLGNLRLSSMNTDAAVPGLNRENVYRLKLVLPSTDCLAKFNELAASNRKLVHNNILAIRCFNQLRDHLLPRLISGKLRIEDAEASVAAITSALETEPA